MQSKSTDNNNQIDGSKIDKKANQNIKEEINNNKNGINNLINDKKFVQNAERTKSELNQLAGLLSKKRDINLNNKGIKNNEKDDNFEVDLFKGDDNYIEVRHYKNTTYNDFFEDIKTTNMSSNDIDLLDLMDQTNVNNEDDN